MVVALVLGVLFNVPVSVAKADTETFNLNREYTLAPVDVYAFVNGGEGIKLKKDADGNHYLTLKLKKGDILRCNMNATRDRQPHIWYKSSLKKVK